MVGDSSDGRRGVGPAPTQNGDPVDEGLAVIRAALPNLFRPARRRRFVFMTVENSIDLAIGDRVLDRDDDDPDEAVVVNCPDVTAADWDVGERTVATFPGNEPYAADADVMVVVFRDDLDEYAPGYAGDEPLPVADLADVGVPHYAFPEPRLRVVETVTPEQQNHHERSNEYAGGTDEGADRETEGTTLRATGTTTSTTPPRSSHPRSALDPEPEPEPDPEPVPEPTPALAELAQRIAESRGTSLDWTVTDEGETVLLVEKLGQPYRIHPTGVVAGDGALSDRLADLAAEYVSTEGARDTADEAGEVDA